MRTILIIIVILIFIFVSYIIHTNTMIYYNDLIKNTQCEKLNNRCDEIECKLNQKEIYSINYLSDLLIIKKELCE